MPEKLVLRSSWALISSDQSFFKHPELSGATGISPQANFRPWKDDYSSIVSVMQ
jgi:hypothetical protein